MKERFKVTINDLKTGDKTAYYVSSYGFQFSALVQEKRTVVTRIVLDYPRVKIKKDKKNGK